MYEIDAVEAFLRFTDKPIISAREAVTAGLAQAWADGLVGIGRGGSPATLRARYWGQAVSLDPSEDGVGIIPAFTPESEEKRAQVGAGASTQTDTAAGTGGQVGVDTADTGQVETRQPRVRRFVVHGAVPVENYSELFRCFVGPAARMNLKKLHLGIQFEMEAVEGQELDPNDPSLKAMKESARQLGLEFDTGED